MDGTELTLLIGAGSGALISFIVALQKSKCSHIRMCWGCIDCIRTKDLQENNNENNNITQV
tara:strand:+ start:213 stop:395 length:183 start_codon:yes stop_codon:yes gene_type:complete